MTYIVLYNSPFVPGGVEQVVRNLLDRFSSRFKSHLTVLCSDPSRPARFDYHDVPCVNISAGARGILDKLFFLGRYVYSYRLFQVLKTQLQPGDVVNIHGIEYALFPSLWRRKIPVPFVLVVTAHGSNFDEISQYVVRGLPWKFWPVKLFYFFYRWTYFLAEKWTCRGVDCFTFINEYIRQFYGLHYSVPPAKGQVIYNGFEAVPENKRPAKTSRIFRALIVGSTVYRKGLDIAIPAVEQLRAAGEDVRLTIVGFSDFPNYSRGRKWDFIDYVGRVAPEQMGRHYDAADFLLLPSRFEGFPLTVLEALQHKLPVVVSPACVFDEIPGHKNLGCIVEDAKPGAWAAAIRDRMLRQESYNEFVRHLNEADLGQFAWIKIATAYEATLAGQGTAPCGTVSTHR